KKDGYQVATIIGGRADLEKDGYQVTIMIEDEGSKPNLNTLSDKGLGLLSQLIESKNIQPTVTPAADNSGTPTETPTVGNPSPSDTQQISLDPLLDWRDRNTEPRPEGAKLDYYQGLNPPYKPRDGFLASLEEMKQMKNGAQIYDLLAPEVTVFGKINPNTISGEAFSNFLNSTGEYQQGWLDTVADQFETYRRDHTRFDTIEMLKNVQGIITIEQFKPFLQISGACNVNMASDIGLTVLLKEANYSDSAIQGVLNLRKAGPIKQVAEVNGLLGYSGVKGQVHPDDYLTTVSTIIHYRIWVRSGKGTGCYYLDTVWQREAGGLKKDWQITQISFRELWNQAAPEIPKLEEPKENEED
ncbi:MAG TPA: hypothetical protein DDW50_12685, partial [Firmicutes bacterium]|nr:hypothetical protein [Bacillota bacterium]